MGYKAGGVAMNSGMGNPNCNTGAGALPSCEAIGSCNSGSGMASGGMAGGYSSGGAMAAGYKAGGMVASGPSGAMAMGYKAGGVAMNSGSGFAAGGGAAMMPGSGYNTGMASGYGAKKPDMCLELTGAKSGMKKQMDCVQKSPGVYDCCPKGAKCQGQSC